MHTNKTGYELPAKVLDYRALLYLIRSKQGKKKKAAGEGAASKAGAHDEDDKGVGGKGERMSPEEKLMMSMLKEESGVDALDRTMERVGVDIEKVMERVQTMTTGGGLRTPGGATGEAGVEDFVPEEGGFEEPDLSEPLAVLQEEEADEDGEGELPPSLFDKGWGVANNFVLVDANSIIFRTYHAMPKLTAADGTPVNAVLGFCNVLNKLLLPAMTQSRVRPYVLVVFDGHAPLHRQTVRFACAYHSHGGMDGWMDAPSNHDPNKASNSHHPPLRPPIVAVPQLQGQPRGDPGGPDPAVPPRAGGGHGLRGHQRDGARGPGGGRRHCNLRADGGGAGLLCLLVCVYGRRCFHTVDPRFQDIMQTRLNRLPTLKNTGAGHEGDHRLLRQGLPPARHRGHLGVRPLQHGAPGAQRGLREVWGTSARPVRSIDQ